VSVVNHPALPEVGKHIPVGVFNHPALPEAGHPFRHGGQALSLRVASGRFTNRRLEGNF